MARTIAEIKDSMTADLMRNPDVARAYGFEAGAAFSSHFSKVSVESLLFYIVACAMWVLENLFDQHRRDVEQRIEAIIPHRPKWYRDKVLRFMEGKELIRDSDTYDTEGMTESEVSACRIVKHAVATESRDASLLTIKVAGESGGERQPLTAEQERHLAAYIGEIKDAGVRVALVNMEADTFCCTVDVYYNAMLDPADVQASCTATIRDYIENLPFNGEYTNMALVDRLQAVEGVKIVELRGSTSQAANEGTTTQINARLTPAAGYFKPGEITVNMKAYDEQG